MVGNSEVGIEMKFKAAGYPVLVSTTHVPELTKVCRVVELAHELACGSAKHNSKAGTVSAKCVKCPTITIHLPESSIQKAMLAF